MCLAVNNGAGYSGVPKMIGLIIAVFIGLVLFVGPLMRITVFNHYVRVGHLSPNRRAAPAASAPSPARTPARSPPTHTRPDLP